MVKKCSIYKGLRAFRNTWKKKKLPKNYRIDRNIWKIWYQMEKKAPYVAGGKLEKWGFGRKTTRLGKKLPRGIGNRFWLVFFMYDRQVTKT